MSGIWQVLSLPAPISQPQAELVSRQSGRIHWLGQVLCFFAIVLAAAVGAFTAATAPAELVTYAYDTPGQLSSSDSAVTDVQGSPVGPGAVSSWGRSVATSTGRGVVNG